MAGYLNNGGAGGVNELLLTVADFGLTAGSPAVANTLLGAAGIRTPAWLMDPGATTEAVTTLVVLPVDWGTIDVDLVWGAAATGDVYWRTQYSQLDEGDLFATAETQVDAGAITVTGVDEVIITRLLTAVVVAGRFLRIEISRVGGNAGDTMAGDAAIVAAIINKAS